MIVYLNPESPKKMNGPERPFPAGRYFRYQSFKSQQRTLELIF